MIPLINNPINATLIKVPNLDKSSFVVQPIKAIKPKTPDVANKQQKIEFKSQIKKIDAKVIPLINE